MQFKKKTWESHLGRLESTYQHINRLSLGKLDVLRYAIQRFSLERGTENSASISFYTLFALPPLLIVTVTIGSYFFDSQFIEHFLVRLIEQNIPVPELELEAFIGQILQQRNAFGIIGLIGLAWSASGVLSILTSSINRAWVTAKPRNVIERRLIGLVIIGALSLILAASTILSTIIDIISIRNWLAIPNFPLTRLYPFGLFGIRLFSFFILYTWLPNTKVKKIPALWGALFAAVAWELTVQIYSVYIRWSLNYYNLIYGSLGSLVGLMFWIYFDCIIILFGAFLSASIALNEEIKQTG